MTNKNKMAFHNKTIQYIDLFYMTPEKISAKEIAGLFQDATGLKVELWEAMNIVELILENGNSIDFEAQDANFKAPSDAAFIKSRKISTIFSVHLNEADLPELIPYLKQLTAHFSGFACADSEDFTPVLAGSSCL